MRLPVALLECPDTAAAVAELPSTACADDLTLTARDLVCRDFRDALGSFPTGVTVVTTLAPDGSPIGVTISSFNSVSLDPPLILWSLSCVSPSLAAFAQAGHYAVNVLAADQQWISECFAARENDRFNGVKVSRGLAESHSSKAVRRGSSAPTRRSTPVATTSSWSAAYTVLPAGMPTSR
jgi:hypothetical protein